MVDYATKYFLYNYFTVFKNTRAVFRQTVRKKTAFEPNFN